MSCMVWAPPIKAVLSSATEMHSIFIAANFRDSKPSYGGTNNASIHDICACGGKKGSGHDASWVAKSSPVWPVVFKQKAGAGQAARAIRLFAALP